jgi:hypothetical protein
MNMLILTPENQSELQALNASGDTSRQLSAVPLTDGNAALNADLLSDCGEGQTWEHYGPFLESLPMDEVDPAEIVEPTLS